MKYLRTTDKLYEVVGETDKVFIVKAKKNKNETYSLSKKSVEIVYQDNYIHERMVNCFVYYIKSIPCECQTTSLYHAIELKERDLRNGFDWTDVYGAIWTPKGLKFVCRLVKIGYCKTEHEWELL